LRKVRLRTLHGDMKKAEEINILAEQEEENGFSRNKREALRKAKLKK